MNCDATQKAANTWLCDLTGHDETRDAGTHAELEETDPLLNLADSVRQRNPPNRSAEENFQLDVDTDSPKK